MAACSLSWWKCKYLAAAQCLISAINHSKASVCVSREVKRAWKVLAHARVYSPRAGILRGGDIESQKGAARDPATTQMGRERRRKFRSERRGKRKFYGNQFRKPQLVIVCKKRFRSRRTCESPGKSKPPSPSTSSNPQRKLWARSFITIGYRANL